MSRRLYKTFMKMVWIGIALIPVAGASAFAYSYELLGPPIMHLMFG